MPSWAGLWHLDFCDLGLAEGGAQALAAARQRWPELWLLQLSWLDLSGDRAEAVLAAAAQHCHRLNSLGLDCRHTDDQGASLQPLLYSWHAISVGARTIRLQG